MPQHTAFRRRWALLILVSMAGLLLHSRDARAQGSCSSLTVTTVPALPSSISVSNPVGTTVWSGSLVMTGTGCTGAYTGGQSWWVVPFVSTSATPIATSTGAASGLTITALGGDTLSTSPTLGCTVTRNNYSYYRYLGCNATFSGLSFTATFPAVIKVASSPGPSVMSATRLTTTPTLGYWAGTQWSSSFADPGGAPGNLAATYVGVVPTITQDTCTISTPNVSVVLPNVSRTSLGTAGATAGITRFTFNYTSCTANGGVTGNGFSGTQTWSFTPDPASPTYIQNSGSAPKASNVVVQLLDANLAPIANGATTTLSVPKAGGALSQTFYARYVATGPAGSGNVKGVATFDITYD